MLSTIPVLSSSNINRDIEWYKKHVGFELAFTDGELYVGLHRGPTEIHLQYHHGTKDDPIHGSVVKFFTHNIEPLVKEFVERGTILEEKFRKNTPWNTHEFGFYDLNKNALFFVQNIP